MANTLGDQYRAMEARISNQNSISRAEMHKIHKESVHTYDKLLYRDPHDAEAFMHMMWARKFACDWDGFGGKMKRMIELIEKSVSVDCVSLNWYAHDCQMFAYDDNDLGAGA